MAERWLTVQQAADEYFLGKVMRVYRRVYSGEIPASNEAIHGRRPRYRIAESAIQRYFRDRTLRVPSRGLA